MLLMTFQEAAAPEESQPLAKVINLDKVAYVTQTSEGLHVSYVSGQNDHIKSSFDDAKQKLLDQVNFVLGDNMGSPIVVNLNAASSFQMGSTGEDMTLSVSFHQDESSRRNKYISFKVAEDHHPRLKSLNINQLVAEI